MRFVVAVVFAMLAATAAASSLVVESAWIRAAPPGAVVLAGYATLGNESDATVEIVAATSGDFARVELHEMSMREGVMRMRALDRAVVPARGTLDLAPGGTHLMLHEPKRALVPGDRVEIVLRDASGVDHVATFEVRAPH